MYSPIRKQTEKECQKEEKRKFRKKRSWEDHGSDEHLRKTMGQGKKNIKKGAEWRDRERETGGTYLLMKKLGLSFLSVCPEGAEGASRSRNWSSREREGWWRRRRIGHIYKYEETRDLDLRRRKKKCKKFKSLPKIADATTMPLHFSISNKSGSWISNPDPSPGLSPCANLKMHYKNLRWAGFK